MKINKADFHHFFATKGIRIYSKTLLSVHATVTGRHELQALGFFPCFKIDVKDKKDLASLLLYGK